MGYEVNAWFASHDWKPLTGAEIQQDTLPARLEPRRLAGACPNP